MPGKKNLMSDCEPVFIADHEGYVATMKYENEKMEKRAAKREKKSAVLHGVAFIFFTPISIALSALSCVSKIIGSIAAIGMPYGLYCAYKTAMLMKDGIALSDVSQRYPVLLFVIFPFIAFMLNLILDKTVDIFHRYM